MSPLREVLNKTSHSCGTKVTSVPTTIWRDVSAANHACSTTIHRRKRYRKLMPHIMGCVCMPSTGQQTCRVCIEYTHTDTVSVLEHRTWDTGYSEWCHKVPHVSLWQTIRHHNRSQTFAHDTQQTAEECTSTSTTPDQDTWMGLSSRVSTWQTYDNRRCHLKTSQPGSKRWDITRRYSGWHHARCRRRDCL